MAWFYTLNSKYRISWECAELFIELAGGAGGGDGGAGASVSTAPSWGVVVGVSVAAAVDTRIYHFEPPTHDEPIDRVRVRVCIRVEIDDGDSNKVA